ncbi:MAG: DUF6785 family protein, partial [Candidatus Baldrarchaeia archaeon]
MSTEKKIRERISVTEIVAAIVIMCFFFLWAYVSRSLSMTKYWVANGVWFPFFWLLVLVYVLGRAGIRINKTFILAVIIFLYITAGKGYLFFGVDGVNITGNIAGSFSASMAAWAWPAEAKEYLSGLVPSWLIPQDEVAVERYYLGGGEPYWSTFVAPIIVWSLLLTSIVMISITQSWLFMGPQWWEDERLMFPTTIPTYYLVNSVYGEKQEEWGKLFRLKTTENKIFWIAFLIGLILNAPYILTQIMPALPVAGYIGGGYGRYDIHPERIPGVAELLPGAELVTCAKLDYLLLSMLMPFDFLVTVLLFRLIFGFIYPVTAVRMGWVPPGSNPAVSPPFPYDVVAFGGGGILGLSLYSLWMMRGRIKKALGVFSKDYKVEGISMRTGLTIMIVGIIIFLGIWIAAGANPLMAILWFIIFTLMNIGGTRFGAEYLTIWYGCHGADNWQLLFPIGSGLGVWSPVSPQSNQALAINGIMSGTMGTCISPYGNNGAISNSYLTLSYGAAKGSNVDMRKLFFEVLIALIIMIPFALTFNVWFNSHVGLSNTGEAGLGVNIFNPIRNGGLNTGIAAQTWGVGLLGYSERWGWTIVGAIIVIVL